MPFWRERYVARRRPSASSCLQQVAERTVTKRQRESNTKTLFAFPEWFCKVYSRYPKMGNYCKKKKLINSNFVFWTTINYTSKTEKLINFLLYLKYHGVAYNVAYIFRRCRIVERTCWTAALHVCFICIGDDVVNLMKSVTETENTNWNFPWTEKIIPFESPFKPLVSRLQPVSFLGILGLVPRQNKINTGFAYGCHEVACEQPERVCLDCSLSDHCVCHSLTVYTNK